MFAFAPLVQLDQCKVISLSSVTSNYQLHCLNSKTRPTTNQKIIDGKALLATKITTPE